MADKHQLLKKVEILYAADGGIEQRFKTVDDGWMNEGQFESGTIRRLEATAEEVESATGIANTVTEGRLRALRSELTAKIEQLTQERDEARRRVAAVHKALN